MTKLVSSLKTLLGVVLVAAAMLLSLPGIDAVRAEEAVVDASGPAGSDAGPTCSAATSDRAIEIAAMSEIAAMRDIEAVLASARAEQEREWAAKGWGPKEAAEAGQSVVLNGRGYNGRRPLAAPVH